MKSLKKLMGGKKGEDGAVKDSSSKNKAVLTEPILNPGFYGAFPSAFTLYLTQLSTDKKGDDYFSICQTGAQIQPLNVFSVHKGMVKHHITFYSSNRYDSPPLALAGIDKLFTGSPVLALPGPANNPEPKNNIITLKDHKKWTSDLFSFAVPIGERSETFEWRGDDVRQKKATPFERKLVRLSNAQGVEEVVGIWQDADEQAVTTGRMGAFELQGSGATGELGQYWTLLTVVSCIKLFQNSWEARAAADKMIKAAPALLGQGLSLGLG